MPANVKVGRVDVGLDTGRFGLVVSSGSYDDHEIPTVTICLTEALSCDSDSDGKIFRLPCGID